MAVGTRGDYDLMGPLKRLLATAGLLLLAGGAAPSADADETSQLSGRVSAALASGSAAALSALFPTDRKVAVTLDRIADLRGYVGSGPLVEAIRRYLDERAEARFDASPQHEGSTRVKGTLVTRDRSGRRERVGLVFSFERIDGVWRAVEVRETG